MMLLATRCGDGEGERQLESDRGWGRGWGKEDRGEGKKEGEDVID